jgi:hypothetical protein
VVVDEPPQSDEAVQCAGLAEVFQNATDADHCTHRILSSKGTCFAAS